MMVLRGLHAAGTERHQTGRHLMTWVSCTFTLKS